MLLIYTHKLSFIYPFNKHLEFLTYVGPVLGKVTKMKNHGSCPQGSYPSVRNTRMKLGK